ncbi:MAG: GGDEF domain-containing protein [Nitrospirae bacterium]|nr:GGDEF domain-containing protein [Nitrospirota bacterium]
MRLDSLKKEAIMVKPLTLPVSVTDALKDFIKFRVEIIPVMHGNYLKGLYFRDTVALVTDCKDGKACLDFIAPEALTEMPYIDISSGDNAQIDNLKTAIESETSAALMMKGIYLGMVPHKKMVAFVHEQKIKEAIMTNPLTGLPGNYTIRKEFERKSENEEKYYVCYLDLNDFKAYNDKYGVVKGDEVLKFTSFLLLQRCGENFVGHVGGDDFIFFLPVDTACTILESIVSDFDKGIFDFYSETHRRQGGIITLDREGRTRSFPIMSTAIAAVLVEGNHSFEHVNTSLAALKKSLKEECRKNKGGSLYAYD